MIVEFIGCDGAGKTTLCRMLRDHGLGDRSVVVMPDLLLDRPVLRRVTHPTAVNLVQDVCGLPFFARSLRRRRGFVAFEARSLHRRAPSAFVEVNEMRGVVRTVGMFELASRRAPNRVVLSDDGPVLTAYFFALGDGDQIDHDEVESFATLVPLPDVLVHVRAPVEALVRRAVSRPDRRRHHARKSPAQIERRIRRTVEAFELVAASAPLRARVVAVENGDAGGEARQRLVEELAASVERALARRSHEVSRAQPYGAGQLRLEPGP